MEEQAPDSGSSTVTVVPAGTPTGLVVRVYLRLLGGWSVKLAGLVGQAHQLGAQRRGSVVGVHTGCAEVLKRRPPHPNRANQ